MRKFFIHVISYLSLIPKILWFPIETIIFVIYELFYRINRRITEGFSSEKFEENKIRRIVYKAVGATLRNHSNIMNSYLSRRIAKIFTLLLQIISLITTYAGFTFFLGALNPVAPLFVAIVVQGGCYYLLNYTSSNKRTGKWRRNILLIILVGISVFTSYIGIFNSIVNPIENMEDTYYSYKTATDNLIDYKIGQVLTKYENSDIENTYNYIKDMSSDAAIKINTLDDLPETDIEYSYDYDNQGNIIGISSKENTNPEYKELSNQIALLNPFYDKLVEFLNEYNCDNVKYAYNSLFENPEKYSNSDEKKVYNQFQDAIHNAEEVDKILNGDKEISDSIAELNLSALEEYDSTKKNYNTLKPPSLSSLTSSDVINSKGNSDTKETVDSENTTDTETDYLIKDNIFNILNRMVVPENLITAENTRNLIISSAKNNYRNINEEKVLDEVSSDKNLLSYIKKFKESYNRVINIESPQIMALVSPFANHIIIGKAIFSFAIAAIIDGLSVLIAFALIAKKKSSLYFDDISKYRANREEMVEECFMYICLNKIKENANNGKLVSSETQITYIVAQKMNEIMSSFLSKIHYCYFPDEFNAFGYISKEDYDNFDKEEKRLFVTFCNISMIQAFHQKEIVELINHEFDENDKNSNTPKANKDLVKSYYDQFNQNQVYYIVSKSLHVWVCENFSELLQNIIMFYDDENLFPRLDEHSLGDDTVD